MNKFSTIERMDIDVERDLKAREVLMEKMRRQHHFDFFKNKFRAPIAIGRNLHFAKFKSEYAAIISMMTHPFDRPECPRLLQAFRELVQDHSVPPEIKSNEVTISYEYKKMEDDPESKPAKPIKHLEESKFRYHVDKADHREVLSKWCVAPGSRSTITLVVKRMKTSSVD